MHSTGDPGAGHTLEQILGIPDNLKFRSSMTLFAQATRDNEVFVEALRIYCNGEPDGSTLQRCGRLGQYPPPAE
jgi:uncharacterized protein (DUF1810 family)